MKISPTYLRSIADLISNSPGLFSINLFLLTAGQLFAQNVWSGANSENWNGPGNLNLGVPVDNQALTLNHTSAGGAGVQHFSMVNGPISKTGGTYGITKSGGGSITVSNPANRLTVHLPVTSGTTNVSALAEGGLPSPIGTGTDLCLSEGALSFDGYTKPAVWFNQINLPVNGTFQNNGSVASSIGGSFSRSGGNVSCPPI